MSQMNKVSAHILNILPGFLLDRASSFIQWTPGSKHETEMNSSTVQMTHRGKTLMSSGSDSRYGAVGFAGKTVSRGIEVFPHGVLVLLHSAGTTLNTHISILIVHTLPTLMRTLETYTVYTFMSKVL